jgi:hypothetical protein
VTSQFARREPTRPRVPAGSAQRRGRDVSLIESWLSYIYRTNDRLWDTPAASLHHVRCGSPLRQSVVPLATS